MKQELSTWTYLCLRFVRGVRAWVWSYSWAFWQTLRSPRFSLSGQIFAFLCFRKPACLFFCAFWSQIIAFQSQMLSFLVLFNILLFVSFGCALSGPLEPNFVLFLPIVCHLSQVVAVCAFFEAFWIMFFAFYAFWNQLVFFLIFGAKLTPFGSTLCPFCAFGTNLCAF